VKKYSTADAQELSGDWKSSDAMVERQATVSRQRGNSARHQKTAGEFLGEVLFVY